MSPEQFNLIEVLFNEETVTITTVEFPCDINGGLKICYRYCRETYNETKMYSNNVTEMNTEGRITRAERIGKG